MATTKIWTVKANLKCALDYAANPEKTDVNDLENVISYAMNGEKTVSGDERSCFVSGINCYADTAFEEMMNVKSLYGKTGGNAAYHCYQSFRPGEVTPEECHRLGVELAEKMWGDKYQVLIATHLDRDHLHNHLVVNSVSFIDGKKFNCDKGAYRRFRTMSDEICRENGLSVIENPRGRTPRQLYFAEKNGEPTRHNLMREAIDNAISLSTNVYMFRDLMRRQGYILSMDPNRKYATIRSIHSKKSTRLYRLGEEYDIPGIENRIGSQDIDAVYERRNALRERPFHQPHAVRSQVRRKNLRKVGGIYGLYLKYCYLLGVIPKRNHRPLSPEMREACRMCDRYSEAARFLAGKHIRTEADLSEYIFSTEDRMDVLIRERNRINNRLRRAKDPGRIDELKAERSELTGRISLMRKDLRTADFILERSEKIREDIAIEHAYRRGDHVRTKSRTNDSKAYER